MKNLYISPAAVAVELKTEGMMMTWSLDPNGSANPDLPVLSDKMEEPDFDEDGKNYWE
ncbi:MAG: hypothetical protein PUB53_03890 [Bacteroidales bacterium]|nr:hypothetical protein [Bacteroidales bacterium]